MLVESLKVQLVRPPVTVRPAYTSRVHDWAFAGTRVSGSAHLSLHSWLQYRLSGSAASNYRHDVAAKSSLRTSDNIIAKGGSGSVNRPYIRALLRTQGLYLYNRLIRSYR
jgi:hypothetical protein